ncbi:4Fe-4S dicluster domain-containing protein [Arcanobacterium canis]
MSDHLTSFLRWCGAQDPIGYVVIACQHVDDIRVPRRAVGVVWDSCLSDAKVEELLQILACGVDMIALQGCEHARKLGNIGQRLTKRISFDDAPKHSLFHSQILDLREVPLPRRAAFGLPIDVPLDLKADSADRTLQALDFLGLGATQIDDLSNTEPGSVKISWPGVSLVADGCDLCGVCVKACSHRAMVIEDVDGRAQLIHDLRACRGCGDCIALCPQRALTTGTYPDIDTVRTEPRQTLIETRTRRCERCGTSILASEGKLCKICAFRQTNPFGAFDPRLIREQITSNNAEHGTFRLEKLTGGK